VRGAAILAALLIAQSSRGQSVANYAGEFLQLGVGARSLAMGGTGAAISEDATAGYWNPAGLSQLQYPMVTGMHESRFDATVKYDYGALGIPLDARTSAGISVLHLGIGDIRDTRNALVDINNNGQLDPDEYLNYAKVRSFSNYDWVAIISFAHSSGPPVLHLLSPATDSESVTSIAWGVNAKIVYRRLDPQTTGSGIGFDVGARYAMSNGVTLAAVAQDLTTTLLSYTTGTKELVSPTLKLGADYVWHITSDGAHRLTPTVDADIRFEKRVGQVEVGSLSLDLHEGVEYAYKNIFALRAGYNEMNMWSAGAGVAFSKFHVDYAYLSMNGQDGLGPTHRVSFSILLDQPKWKRRSY
jgi:hypothetical protein